jgi:2'-5' RNA ligase
VSTIVTVRLDEESQARFEALRQRHFPPERNVVPAHVTVFHTLPDGDEVAAVLGVAAAEQRRFAVEWTGLRPLGRGVAYVLRAPELVPLQARLAEVFAEHVTAQDRQGFRPHLVVQNKATAEAARRLLEELEQEPMPAASQAVGLDWWEYLGGPWRLLRTFPFE